MLAGHDDLGSLQLVEIAPDGTTTELTDLPSRCAGRYVPGRRQVLVEHDSGGDEKWQISLLDLSTMPASPVGLDDLTPVVRDAEHMNVLHDVTQHVLDLLDQPAQRGRHGHRGARPGLRRGDRGLRRRRVRRADLGLARRVVGGRDGAEPPAQRHGRLARGPARLGCADQPRRARQPPRGRLGGGRRRRARGLRPRPRPPRRLARRPRGHLADPRRGRRARPRVPRPRGTARACWSATTSTASTSSRSTRPTAATASTSTSDPSCRCRCAGPTTGPASC